MPTNDLSPAAEAFLRTHVFASRWDEARADLAALLETARPTERELAATQLEDLAARIRGIRKRVPQVDEHVASVLECAAEKIRRKE